MDIIIVGFGGVGRALVDIITKQVDYFQANFPDTVEMIKIVAICELDGALMSQDGLNLSEIVEVGALNKFTQWVPKMSAIDVINEISADLVVECSWTNPETGDPALSTIKAALTHKMHVVSSNKGPFYLKYQELNELAQQNGVQLGIEATVGSAIPCLTARDSIAGTHISSIRAILNGTSNYILSRMASENLSFDLALKEAQELGYAEADPTLDIEGYDAAGKIVILANELLGWNKTISDVQIEGITKINAHAIDLAKKENYLIKHVAVAEKGSLRVGLQLIPVGSPLAVNGTLNVVEITTKNAGPIMFIGRGAGRPEAASGILSDIIRIMQSSQVSKQ